MSSTLTVGGHDITSLCPVDIAPIRWQAAGPDNVGSISWTMEDDGTLDIEAGDIVTLVAEGATVAAGPLLNMRHRRGVGGLAYVDCEAVGWGWYLDRRVVPAIPLMAGSSTDDAAVIQLVAGWGGPIGTATIAQTASSTADALSIPDPTTLRGALDTVVEWAERAGASTAHPRYFVDESAALWYYNGDAPPAGDAPARIGDAQYMRSILDLAGANPVFPATAFYNQAFQVVGTTPDLVAYWPMHDGGRDAIGTADLSTVSWPSLGARPNDDLWSGGYLGVLNEPAVLAPLFDGTARGTAISTALPGTADFSIEAWFKSADSTAYRTIYSGESLTSPMLRLNSTGKVQLLTRGGTVEATSTNAWDDDAWHHVVAVHYPSVGGTVWVDGAVDNAGSTAQTFGAPGTVYVATRENIEEFTGRLQHLAVYQTAIGTAVIADHYVKGLTYAPEDLIVEYAHDNRAHAAYTLTYGGTIVGTRYASDSESWEAGQVQIVYTDDEVSAGFSSVTDAAAAAADAELAGRVGLETAEFNVVNLGGWKPGQTVYIRDTRLTGGAWLTHIVQSVEGEINSNDVRYRVVTGEPQRSLVQAVASK